MVLYGARNFEYIKKKMKLDQNKKKQDRRRFDTGSDVNVISDKMVVHTIYSDYIDHRDYLLTYA